MTGSSCVSRRWVALLLSCALVGCAGVESTLELAASGDLKTRTKKLRRIEQIVRKLIPPRAKHAETRARLEQFFLQRFDRNQDTNYEKDTTLRSQIVALAVQGEFDCAAKLVAGAIRDDDEARLVRLVAIQSLRDLPLGPHRELLAECVQREDDTQTRIELVKTMRCARESADAPQTWAPPLIAVFLDRHEDASVRFQAHRAAVELTGAEYAITDENSWRTWLQQHPEAIQQP
ncbi:MAG: hypothetical protein ACKVX7_02555 [Planctomycetota bacterium]